MEAKVYEKSKQKSNATDRLPVVDKQLKTMSLCNTNAEPKRKGFFGYPVKKVPILCSGSVKELFAKDSPSAITFANAFQRGAEHPCWTVSLGLPCQTAE